MQQKFRFACALKEARRCERRIVGLWEQIEATTFGREPRWSETTVEIAKQIAAEKAPIQIRKDADEDEVAYVRRAHELRKRFPTFAILPELEYGDAFGLRMLEWMDVRPGSHRGPGVARSRAGPSELGFPPCSARCEPVRVGRRRAV